MTRRIRNAAGDYTYRGWRIQNLPGLRAGRIEASIKRWKMTAPDGTSLREYTLTRACERIDSICDSVCGCLGFNNRHED